MAFSIQRAVSDGTMTLLPVSIEYFDREEISVLFDGMLNARQWAWVGTTDKTISFTPAVANTMEVMIVRSTDLAELRHQFSLGAQFTAESLDESLLQILHIAQEAKEGSNLGEIFQNLNFHGFKAINMGNGSDPGDAVNHAQMEVHDATIVGYMNTTDGYKNAAAASAAAALVSETNAAGAADTKVSDHVALADPHTQYAKESDLGSAAYQPISAFLTAGPAVSSGLTVSTARLLGRTTAGSGPLEEVSVGGGLILTGGMLSVDPAPRVRASLTMRGTVSGSLTYTRSGTTVTVTHPSHGYSSGMLIEVVSATDGGVNGAGKVITVTGANTYTFQTGALGANGTLQLRSVVYTHYNIASVVTNGTSDYTITFATPFQDTYYSILSGGCGNNTGSGGGWGFTPRDSTFVLAGSCRGIYGTQNSAYESNLFSINFSR